MTSTEVSQTEAEALAPAPPAGPGGEVTKLWEGPRKGKGHPTEAGRGRGWDEKPT